MIIIDGWICWRNSAGKLEKVIPFEEYKKRAEDIASIMGILTPAEQKIRVHQVKEDINRRRREWMR